MFFFLHYISFVKFVQQLWEKVFFSVCYYLLICKFGKRAVFKRTLLLNSWMRTFHHLWYAMDSVRCTNMHQPDNVTKSKDINTNICLNFYSFVIIFEFSIFKFMNFFFIAILQFVNHFLFEFRTFFRHPTISIHICCSVFTFISRSHFTISNIHDIIRHSTFIYLLNIRYLRSEMKNIFFQSKVADYQLNIFFLLFFLQIGTKILSGEKKRKKIWLDSINKWNNGPILIITNEIWNCIAWDLRLIYIYHVKNC